MSAGSSTRQLKEEVQSLSHLLSHDECQVIGVTVTSSPRIYMPLEMHFVNDDFHGCNPLSCIS